MDLFRKLGRIPEEGPSFRVETSCSIKRLLEDEELCCWTCNRSLGRFWKTNLGTIPERSLRHSGRYGNYGIEGYNACKYREYRTGRNLTRTFPKIIPKFVLQNLPFVSIKPGYDIRSTFPLLDIEPMPSGTSLPCRVNNCWRVRAQSSPGWWEDTSLCGPWWFSRTSSWLPCPICPWLRVRFRFFGLRRWCHRTLRCACRKCFHGEASRTPPSEGEPEDYEKKIFIADSKRTTLLGTAAELISTDSFLPPSSSVVSSPRMAHTLAEIFTHAQLLDFENRNSWAGRG